MEPSSVIAETSRTRRPETEWHQHLQPGGGRLRRLVARLLLAAIARRRLCQQILQRLARPRQNAHGAARGMGVQVPPSNPDGRASPDPRPAFVVWIPGLINPITRPIETPGSSSAGTIARGRHEVRRLGRTSLEQIETTWWTYRVLAGWQRRWIARPLVELRI